MRLIAPISSVNCFDFFAIEIMDEVWNEFFYCENFMSTLCLCRLCPVQSQSMINRNLWENQHSAVKITHGFYGKYFAPILAY